MTTLLDNMTDKYINKHDKFDSLYIFVLYDCDYDVFSEKINKIMNIMDNISDIKRRGFLKNRIHEFREYIKINNKIGKNIDGIFFVSDSINEYDLDKYHKDTLLMFDHPKFSYDYGSNYPISWLKNLLLDRDYVNAVHIKNNDIKINWLNPTKKKKIFEETIKAMDLKQLISDKIPKGDKYIIHGSSVVLKSFVDVNALFVSTKEMNDDALFIEIGKAKFRKNNEMCQDLLTKLTDPKEGKKIVFGKDIKTAIKDNLLSILYCTEQISDKVSKEVPKELLIFDIKIVKSFDKDDIGEILEKNYSGMVGVKFY